MTIKAVVTNKKNFDVGQKNLCASIRISGTNWVLKMADDSEQTYPVANYNVRIIGVQSNE